MRIGRMFLAGTLGLVGLVAGPAVAGAAPLSIVGTPLTVSVDTLGQCQSTYPGVGGNFYIGSNMTGDCGFFIATPAAPTAPTATETAQPLDLQNMGAGTVFGFRGTAGPRGLTDYAAVSNGPSITGNGTSASPYTLVTVYTVNDTSANAVLQVTQTTTYVNGQPFFRAYYDVKNVTNAPGFPATDTADHNKTIFYRAMYAGDLYVNGNDQGTGVFIAGPPRFVGGQNASSGVLGGFQESLSYLDGTPTPPWDSYAEDFWDNATGIWAHVAGAATLSATGTLPPPFANSVSPTLFDNGAGVAWDTNLTATHGLAPGQEQKYSIINLATIPSTLVVSPTSQGLVQGQTAAINLSSTNSGGAPYANTPVRYTITGANAQSGTVTTNAAGAAQIRYVGTHPGVDLVSMYVDLGGTGTLAAADPTGSAQVTFVPPPPVPNSGITVKSVKVNADGTLTITYVPNDPGQGTLTVTVPTAGVASIAKKKKAKHCKSGQSKIKGKCRPSTTKVGSASGAGTPGVPLTLSVKPSGQVKKRLATGRSLHVTATLVYQSARGGQPSRTVYHVTLKGKKKKHPTKKKH